MEKIKIKYKNKIRESNKAILFNIQSKQCWIPKSQINSLDDSSITMPV